MTIKQQQKYTEEYRSSTIVALGINRADYEAYRALSVALNDISTAYTNGEITDEAEEILVKPILAQLKIMTIKHKLYFFHQTDPRGESLYLSKTPITQVNYNNGHVIL